MSAKVKDIVKKGVFTPAKEGERIDINGHQVEIDGHFIAEDNSFSIPCIHMMSDFRYVTLCLIDRLFHPEKYTAEGEDVPQVIEKEINQLVDMSPEEKKTPLRLELEAMRRYVDKLPEEVKPEAEKYIINATRGTARNQAK